MEEKYDLHPLFNGEQLQSYLLYIYDGREGQHFWDTGKLPDGQDVHDLVPNVGEVHDIGTGRVAKHKRNWAHKFSITLKK